MRRQTAKTPRELRRFGLLMAVPLGLIAAGLAWQDRTSWPALAGLAAVFALVGLAVPRLLAPVERAWMWLARLLGMVMTTVLLTASFVLLITPIGLLMRLLGKRPLKLGFDRSASTYWQRVDPSGPASRPNVPY